MKLHLLPCQISEHYPTSIVADFDRFVAAIQQPACYLTAKLTALDRATLAALNRQMATHQTDVHDRADQPRYPLLHLFQRLCLASRLCHVEVRGGKKRMVPTATLHEFSRLNPAERWMALLEALWVDLNWGQFSATRLRAENDLAAPIPKLLMLPLGRATPVTLPWVNTRNATVFFDHRPLLLFSFFGLLSIELAPENDTSAQRFSADQVIARSITLTALGKAVLGTLEAQRPWPLWNRVASRTFMAQLPAFPGQSQEPGDGGVQEPTPFFKAFEPLFPLDALQHGLPRIQRQQRDATFVIRAALSGGVWRQLELSDQHTLRDLHEAIQSAVGFDDDHLYAFYLDDLQTTDECFNDPRMEEPPYADQARLGAIDLYKGQRFLYLFDFGDNWRFDITVINVLERRHDGAPRLVKRVGAAPNQYPDYDW